MSPDHRYVATHRDRAAESVVRRGIGSGQLLLLAPHSATAHKNVRGALGAIRGQSPDNRRVTAHRDRLAETVARNSVGQLLLLAPHSATAHKNVRGSRGPAKSPDHRRVPAH